MTLAAYQTLVNDLVRDRDGVISTMQRDQAIADAVARYSADRPRLLVVDVDSAGGRRTDTPEGWFDGFSTLRDAEFPIGDVPATMLLMGNVRMYRGPSSVQIELPFSLTAGESIRYTFTAQHLLDESDDTVPDAHRPPVAALAAAFLCDQLANYYTTESAPTITADTLDHADKSRKFASRAKELRLQYANTLGVNTTRLAPAAAIVDLDRNASDGGGRIFHPRRGA